MDMREDGGLPEESVIQCYLIAAVDGRDKNNMGEKEL